LPDAGAGVHRLVPDVTEAESAQTSTAR
jgi:hypothetical protein